MTRIIPLTGQVLVQLHPPEEKSGGLWLPETFHDHRPTPEDPLNRKPLAFATVCEIGPWLKNKRGLVALPEFKVRDTVVVSPYAGRAIDSAIDPLLRLVRYRDVLAVLTTEANGHTVSAS